MSLGNRKQVGYFFKMMERECNESKRTLSVIARNSLDGFYYPGYISRSSDSPLQTIKFNALVPQTVPREHIIHVGGAVPWPDLAILDTALVMVRCHWMSINCYVPGIVTSIPRNSRLETKFYTVHLYNGKKVEKQRRSIIKIGNDKYNEVLFYISELKVERDYLNNGNSTTKAAGHDNTDTKASTDSETHRHYMKKEYRKLERQKKKSEKLIVHKYHRSTKDRVKLEELRYECHRMKLSLQRLKNKRTYRKRNALSVDHRIGLNDMRLYQVEFQTPPRSYPRSLSRSPISSNSRQSVTFESRPPHIPTPPSPKSPPKPTPTPVHEPVAENRNKYQDPPRQPKVKRAITRGQTVLARWPDDGWYYFGVVTEVLDNGQCCVQDSTGHTEVISSNDILIDAEHVADTLQPYDDVIALHPSYVYSYAPAVVKIVFQNNDVEVEFYDKTERRLPVGNINTESENTRDVYKISPLKYKSVVEYIQQQEASMYGNSVIARQDRTGIYIRCTMEGSRHNSQEYFLHPFEGDRNYITTLPVHVFDKARADGQLCERGNWKYMLAPVDDKKNKYLPGLLIETVPLRVKCCNGQQILPDSLHDCFYLNEMYYRNALAYYKDKTTNNVS